jgi:hypothetical protein
MQTIYKAHPNSTPLPSLPPTPPFLYVCRTGRSMPLPHRCAPPLSPPSSSPSARSAVAGAVARARHPLHPTLHPLLRQHPCPLLLLRRHRPLPPVMAPVGRPPPPATPRCRAPPSSSSSAPPHRPSLIDPRQGGNGGGLNIFGRLGEEQWRHRGGPSPTARWLHSA